MAFGPELFENLNSILSHAISPFHLVLGNNSLCWNSKTNDSNNDSNNDGNILSFPLCCMGRCRILNGQSTECRGMSELQSHDRGMVYEGGLSPPPDVLSI